MKRLTRLTRHLTVLGLLPLLALTAHASLPGATTHGSTLAVSSTVPQSALVAAPSRPTGGAPGFGRGLTFGAAEEGDDEFGDSRDRVKVTVKADRHRVLPGADVPIAVVFDIRPGWHIWTDDRPRVGELARYADFDGAIHASIRITSNSPLVRPHAGFLVWPEVHGATADVGDGEQLYAVFEGRAIAYLPLTIAADAAPGETSLSLEIDFQACDDSTCKNPATVVLPIALEILAPGTALEATVIDADFANFPVDLFGRIRSGEVAPSLIPFDVFGLQFAIDVASRPGFILLLLVAALGGFLLNFTPCVLPVIPLKIMGLSKTAGHPARCFALGASMSLGVILFWVALGAAVASFTGFKAINQLFQLPLFTIGVGLFIVVMAIGMCGLFVVNLPQWVYGFNPRHDTHVGSVGFGVMTAVLSTPCTAPLMGAAAAWAATQNASTTLSVFLAIGAGMALPYLVLSAFPKLVSRMPKTGPASDLIKQVMGGLLIAAGAYFIGAGMSGLLVDAPDPPSRFFWWVVATLATASGLWLAYRTIRISNSLVNRVTFGGLGLAIAALSLYVGVSQTGKGPINWVYYTPERFAQAKAAGQVVVMDFTAEWCLNCKALEAGVLFREHVAALMAPGTGVTPIKVDLTGNNEAGNDMLVRSGRRTIPLLIVFAPDGTEVFKSDSYTPGQVVEAIERARALGKARASR